MQKDKAIQVRVDAALKEDVEKILSSLGLSMSQSISIFLKQIQFHRGIPFDIKIPTPESKSLVKGGKNK
ncbi:MAG: type II toxin-antitoxin system RelB/DinJ family antitoxin [Candidatus Melainabacteria bacterium]|jgi:DNA-damage-inducible protein J